MDANIIKPIHIIEKFKDKCLLAREIGTIDELRLDSFKHCFSDVVIIGRTLFTQGSFNPENFQCFVNKLILKLNHDPCEIIQVDLNCMGQVQRHAELMLQSY